MDENANEVLKEDVWNYILLNGRYNKVAVKNPVFDQGKLSSIEGLRPFLEKDSHDNPIIPTVHDAENLKRSKYSDFFKKPFKNLLVLTGAGSSIDVGGPSMAQLWTKVEALFKKDNIDGFEIIRKTINYTSDKKDLEALLSRIDGYNKFVNDVKIKIGKEEISLLEVKNQIFNVIKTDCKIIRPVSQFPHKTFLEKLLQRKQTNPRVKIFTLNYDLMFEYAATEVNAIVIDGFSFTYPRTFSGRFFDYDIVQREGSKLQEEDNFIQRVFHLHKLHGSLDWERDKVTEKVHVKEDPAIPLMVYPREAKYEDSYEQPFFEMMARFQRSLRINNDTLLICIGYSFNDKHINAAIEEALNQNPSFRIAVIDPEFDSNKISTSLMAIKELAKESEKYMVVSETFLDFATYFPEIQTYESDNYTVVNLKNGA